MFNRPLLYIEGVKGIYYLARLEPDGTSTRLAEMPDFSEPEVGGPDLSLSTDGKRIAFSTLNHSLYTVNTDGSDLTQVMRNDLKVAAGAPLWSPDGTRLAFVGGSSDPRDGLYVMNVDGANPHRLTPESISVGNDYNLPRWLPNSERLLFVGYDKTKETDYGNIYIIQANGSDLTCLTCQQSVPEPPCCAWPFELAVSPTGLRVAYRWFDGGLYVIDMVSLQPYPVTLSGTQTVWSLTGQRLAFAGEDKSGSNLFVVNADGSNRHGLSVPDFFSKPQWSPNGQKIAFRYDTTTFDEPQKQQLAVIHADGTRLIRLTPDDNLPRRIGDYIWTPDSTQLIFSAAAGSNLVDDTLYRIDADGRDLTRLTTTPGYKRLVAWLSF